MKRRLVVLADGSSIHTQKWLEGLSFSKKWDLFLISMNPVGIRNEIKNLPDLVKFFECTPGKIKESGNNFQYIFQIKKIYTILRDLNPDVISTVYLSSYGVIGAFLKGDAQLIHFTVGHDIMVFPKKGWWQKAVSLRALARADHVVSASATMTERLTNDLKVPKGKILTQQYGVGDWLLNYKEQERNNDFVSNRTWLGNSNVDYFLMILGKLSSVNAVVVGEVVKGWEVLGEKIQKMASCISDCQVQAPLVYEENIALVARSKFLISLTNSDGASLSLLEGMAVGSIPIVSDIVPNREWVEHRKNGFLVPLDDVDGAVSIFKEALGFDLEALGKMRARNKSIIDERGSLRKNMMRVSDRLVSERPMDEDQA